MGKYCWERKLCISHPRKHCAAVFLDGVVYVAGGIGMDGQDLTMVEKYEPCANKWTTVAAMNECRGIAISFIYKAYVWLLGLIAN